MMKSVIFIAIIATLATAEMIRIPLSPMDDSDEKKSALHTHLREVQMGKRAAAPHARLTRGAPLIETMFDFEDVSWLGNITVGTPAQGPFPVVLDTGSSDLWIPASACTSDGCKYKPRYDSSQSSSFVSLMKPMDLAYGTGSCKGYYNYDTVNIANTDVPNVLVGEAESMASFFEYQPVSGILGLGFTVLSNSGTPNLIEQMYTNGQIDRPSVGFYLGDQIDTYGAEMSIGGLDESKYTGELTSILVQKEAYWQLKMANMMVDGSVEDGYECGESGCNVIIDTGTTVITGPESALNPILAKIGNVSEDCSNLDDLPVVSFTFTDANGEYTFDVSPEIYIIKSQTGADSYECSIGFEPMNSLEFLLSGKLWIIGDTFIRQYYTVFDKTEPATISFALATGVPTP